MTMRAKLVKIIAWFYYIHQLFFTLRIYINAFSSSLTLQNLYKCESWIKNERKKNQKNAFLNTKLFKFILTFCSFGKASRCIFFAFFSYTTATTTTTKKKIQIQIITFRFSHLFKRCLDNSVIVYVLIYTFDGDDLMRMWLFPCRVEISCSHIRIYPCMQGKNSS